MGNRRGIVIALVLAIAFVPIAHQPAAIAAGSCAPDHLCVWADAGFTGCTKDMTKLSSQPYFPGISWDNCPGTINDAISSIQNNQEFFYRYSKDVSYKGTKFCLGGHTSVENLRAFGDSNDSFSSVEAYVSQNGDYASDWKAQIKECRHRAGI